MRILVAEDDTALASFVKKGLESEVISLREVGFFLSASADIKSSSQPAFSRIVSLLAQRNYRIRIEGPYR